MEQMTWVDIGAVYRPPSSLQSIIAKYISNGSINIGEADWRLLNGLYEQNEILECLKQEVISGNIVLPMKRYSESDAVSSFVELMQYRGGNISSAKLTTRYPYEFDNLKHGLYIDESNVGNVASDYFQQENRYKCGSMNSPSPVRVWSNEKFLNGALSALWSLKCKSVNDHTLRTCLSLRKYIASQFKPAVAKSIYERFKSKDVLDFSAGWGDRLCGFYACENTRCYIGIDPNESVHKGYGKQVGMYASLTDPKETMFICKPAEDVRLGRFTECVDTVFTSPPYFNIEKYTDDDTQSYKRYRKLDEWLENFLFRAIDLSVDALKPNGHMIINISDCYSNHQVHHICDPMNRYIESLGMEYQGVIGMRMAKRPNSKAVSDGIFVEPMWVWKKVSK